MKKIINNVGFLNQYIWKYKKSLYIYIFMSSLIQAMQLLLNVIGLRMIIDAITTGDTNKAYLSILIYALLNLLCTLYYSISLKISSKSFSIIDMKITQEMINASTEINYSCFDDANYYDIHTRALSQASGATQRLVGTYISIVSNIVSIIALTSVIITMISFEFVLLSVLNVVVAYFVILIQNKWNFNFGQKMTPVYRRANYFANLFFERESAKEIRIFQSSHYFSNKYETHKSHAIKETNKFYKKFLIPSYLKDIVFAATSLLTMLLVTRLILFRGATIGMFIATINAVQSLSTQLQSLTSNFPNLVDQSRQIENIRTALESPNNIEHHSPEQITLPQMKNYKVTFENVSFTYPGSDKQIFSDLSFIINAGERICIVGENGQGKTTIFKLLLRLYDPDEGAIYINDINIKKYTAKSLRAVCSVMFQDAIIYSTNLTGNISFSDDALNTASSGLLKQLNLSDSFSENGAIINKPLTRLFDADGVILSGGQQQKLFLTRTLQKESGLIILDEPSSALDPLIEHELLDIINNNMASQTLIIVSHRLMLCRKADRILVLFGGVITEEGTHAELMNNKGLYCEMFQKQAAHYMED